MTTNTTSPTFNKDSVILNLELFNKQYDTALLEYRNAVTNYINFLKLDVSSNGTPNIYTAQGYIYTGTILSQTTSSTLQNCKASCANTVGCSGATYKNSDNKCILNSGVIQLTSGTANDYAIIKQGKDLLLVVQQKNDLLININKRIDDEMKNSGKPLYNQLKQTQDTQAEDLSNQFNTLTGEKKNIDKLLKQYETLDQKQENTNISVDSNYSMYFSLIIIALIIIFALMYFSTPSKPEVKSIMPTMPTMPTMPFQNTELS
jgi:hypothetical protein